MHYSNLLSLVLLARDLCQDKWMAGQRAFFQISKVCVLPGTPNSESISYFRAPISYYYESILPDVPVTRVPAGVWARLPRDSVALVYYVFILKSFFFLVLMCSDHHCKCLIVVFTSPDTWWKGLFWELTGQKLKKWEVMGWACAGQDGMNELAIRLLQVCSFLWYTLLPYLRPK